MSNLLILVKYILDSHMTVSYRKKYEARLIAFVLEKTNELYTEQIAMQRRTLGSQL
ncbi:hypothetical protein [Nostoc sp. WHI]|uniref:hypothetical protein n=1 Tax=Nostoc sp. WHI TaxID=2650611 RepID=UPI0018C49149|nr:hypothetical protein [Nostoc sp. WHI]